MHYYCFQTKVLQLTITFSVQALPVPDRACGPTGCQHAMGGIQTGDSQRLS